jgi:hypothetical protein
MSVKAGPHGGSAIEIQACEAADTSTSTRILRAGPMRAELAGCRVAVVGVGAVGSFLAEPLFRHGIRHLTLIDGQLLRPGNLIRHLAGDTFVGHPKSLAVKRHLERIGLEGTEVDDRHDKLVTPTQAIGLLREHHLVIDATADPRATALLAWACTFQSKPVVSVCVERQGDIVRVDRFPLRGTERHLPPVLNRDTDPVIEHGCDDPVSLTPPVSVVAAAQAACRVALDELGRDCTMPATLLEILNHR